MTRRIGLVLGAGGVGGAAFHAGTLLALHHDLGWDPRSADLVLGTSAGSIVGALLRAGCDTDDLAAWASQVPARPDSVESRDLLEGLAETPARVRPRIRPRVVGPTVVRRVLSGDVSVLTAALALTPFGVLDAHAALARLDDLLPVWPSARLWITAVSTDTGARVVLSGDRGERVSRAVAASCAIPGVFNPVRVGDTTYLDGATASPTNADLLVDADVDAVVVISPMSSGDDGVLPTPNRLARRVARRRLDDEVALLRATGRPVHVLEPDDDTAATMAANPLSRDQAPGVVRQAFLGAGRSVDAALRSDLSAAPPDV